MFCIAGADGFFGAYLQKYLLKTGESVIALNHGKSVFENSSRLINLPFEIEDRASLNAAEALLKQQKNIKLIYLIAAHNPDFVKLNPQRAEKINITAFSNFLTKLSMCDIQSLYYASSDTVYGESKNGSVFTEESPLNPVNIYGEHKAKAEQISLENGFSAVRCSYMFAPSVCRKQHFFDALTAKLQNKEQIFMFTDYIRSSLSYIAASSCLVELMNTKTDKKVFNLCANKPASKYDIGLLAAEYCGADKSLVIPAKSSDGAVFTEYRAGSIIMSNALMFSTAKKLIDTDFYLLRG